MDNAILTALSGQWTDGSRPNDLFEQVIKPSPEKYVSSIIEGLDIGDKRVENGCAELASLLAECHPNIMAPYIDTFIANLKSKAKIKRWEAVCSLGFLATEDKSHKIPSHIALISQFLTDKSIVLQGHAVRSLARIACAYPLEGERILESMKQAASYFPGNKVGFVIEAMALMGGLPALQEPIRAFIRPYEKSDVPIVAKKAKRALKNLRSA